MTTGQTYVDWDHLWYAIKLKIIIRFQKTKMFLAKCASYINWAKFEPFWIVLVDSTVVERQAFTPNHPERVFCNPHEKTFWTTQEAVGTALDSPFANECI